MKVLDTAAFKEYMRSECETSGVTEEVKERIMSRLKVYILFYLCSITSATETD